MRDIQGILWKMVERSDSYLGVVSVFKHKKQNSTEYTFITSRNFLKHCVTLDFFRTLAAYTLASWQLQKISGVKVKLGIVLRKCFWTDLCSHKGGIDRWVQFTIEIETGDPLQMSGLELLEEKLSSSRIYCLDCSLESSAL